jgi:hypothetical protein
LASAPAVIAVAHATSVEAARNIVSHGFDLSFAGQTARKTGQHRFVGDPSGVYFIRADNLSGSPPHPFNHRQRGAWVFATVRFKNPLVLDSMFSGSDRAGWRTYKEVLAEEHGVSGRALTEKLVALGYDGIVTPVEVVTFDLDTVMVDRPKTLQGLGLGDEA